MATPGKGKGEGAQTFPLGTRLGEGGRYELRKLIGTGAMAEVYKAVDHRLGDRVVAIKTLSPSVAAHPLADKLRQLFIQEAKALARVKDDHVVSVLDFGNDGAGTPYMVMEFLSGTDLGVFLKKIHRLRTAEAVDTLLAVCAGVHACHLAGIVHRDLKPANIFLARTPNGDEPKVLDFSVAKLPLLAGGVERSTTELIVGTPSYMSPEQALGRPATPLSDQYSIGALLYRCVYGRPYRPDEVSGSGSLPAEIPPALAAVLARALRANPEQRFPSVHELGRALLPFASVAGQSRWAGYYRGIPVPLDPAVSELLSSSLGAGPSTVGSSPSPGDQRGAATATSGEEGTTVGRRSPAAPVISAPADATATTVADLRVVRRDSPSPVIDAAAPPSPASPQPTARPSSRDLTITLRRIGRTLRQLGRTSRFDSPLLLPFAMALLFVVTFGVAALQAARARHRARAPLQPPAWVSGSPAGGGVRDRLYPGRREPGIEPVPAPPEALAPAVIESHPAVRSEAIAEPPPPPGHPKRARRHPTTLFAIPLGYGPYRAPILR